MGRNGDNDLINIFPPFSVFPEIQRVTLLSSWTTESQESSTIELAIDAPNITIIKWDEICQYILDNTNTLLPIDLYWVQQCTKSEIDKMQTNGKLLFERQPEKRQLQDNIVLDNEWLQVLRELIDAGITMEQFREFLDQEKARKNLNNILKK
ncbi:anti-repressor SinI family protein [Alicyclobacillus tolerans]|uniref:anti-repressor SinI family protein n=1 Tax=Alicyclobacillus tolerans TaxID=90970 RepID=UPI001F361C05|nr:anti-repressor SinI family protein [Alicyclobacillus tolerans]MCF8564877.1 anti-repressor SinI family protein [Alicyclobacillus tolerans]